MDGWMDGSHLKDSNCNKQTINEVRWLYCLCVCLDGWMDESNLKDSNCNKHRINEVRWLYCVCVCVYVWIWRTLKIAIVINKQSTK